MQVRNCLLEERSGERSFSWTPVGRPPLTMKWTLHNVSSAVPPLPMGPLQLQHPCIWSLPASIAFACALNRASLATEMEAFVPAAGPGADVCGSIPESAQAALCG